MDGNKPDEPMTIANMWNRVPPPDGQIVINDLGTVFMSYATLEQLAYKLNDESEAFKEWREQWQKK